MTDDRKLWEDKHQAAAKAAGGSVDAEQAAAKSEAAAEEASGEGSEPEVETTAVEAPEKAVRAAAKPRKA